MTNRKVAMAFLKHFCAGDVDSMAPLLAEDLHFHGPFHQFRSSTEYLDTLKKDPPEKCGCRVLSVTENGDNVPISYDYGKSGGALTVAQLFTFKNQKISEVLLVFDGRGFA